MTPRCEEFPVQSRNSHDPMFWSQGPWGLALSQHLSSHSKDIDGVPGGDRPCSVLVINEAKPLLGKVSGSCTAVDKPSAGGPGTTSRPILPRAVATAGRAGRGWGLGGHQGLPLPGGWRIPGTVRPPDCWADRSCIPRTPRRPVSHVGVTPRLLALGTGGSVHC